MSKVVRLSKDVHRRLEGLAVGFDSENNVIDKLINFYDGKGFVNSESLGDTTLSSKKKDRTKYVFQGQQLGKNKLVLKVVQQYIDDHPAITYTQLTQIFPKEIQGSTGVFSLANAAFEIKQRTGHKRHHIKTDEVIELSDQSIAVCNQWGAGNIDLFIATATQLGYDIDEIAC